MPTDLDDLLRETGSQWRDHVDAVPSTAPVTPWWRRRWVAVAAAAACLVALLVPVYRSVDPVPIAGGFGRGAEGGACASPHLSIAGVPRHAVATLYRGQEVSVKGLFYLNGCQERPNEAAPRPMTATIYLKGHGRSRPLAKATGAGEQGRFTVKVRIPQEFPTGRATLQAGPHGAYSSVVVTIADRSTAAAS